MSSEPINRKVKSYNPIGSNRESDVGIKAYIIGTFREHHSLQ
nr:MAG TPA_asm: hypothetical protein [Caudoviricetes sp.]